MNECEINEKTVFVLDHTQYFGISSESFIDLDFVKSNKQPIGPSLPPISKSLWTYSVEASVEYCRIAWDVFPIGKLIRFIVSDTAAHIVNTWLIPTQNLTHVLNAMSMVGIPPTAQSSDYSVIHGLRAAIEAISEPTEYQKSLMLKLIGTNDEQNIKKISNKGRVICLTSARDNASMKSLEDIFHTVLLQQNTLALSQKEFLPIAYCHLVIINMIPVNLESLVSDRALIEISPLLSSEIHSIIAPEISNKLTHLILSHYDLASTTVTGIPMKEEQNASSSANYDVEIFHPKHSHTVIFGSELVLPTSIKEGSKYETVTLKWCTPRGSGASDLQACLAQHRVTPVDVTSRPSSCLINFLLNGRSVLLEMPRKTGGKLTSHLLAAHGGEIFIHTLHISRSCLEDPPSISEGVGGRVTDYRITDFRNFIQAHKLVPLKSIPEHPLDENLQKARAKLQRHSKYFPLTLGITIIHNLHQYLDPLLSVIGKDELNENEIIQCRQVIFNLINLQSRHEQLPLPNMGHRLKSNKNKEQYRLLWAELEILIQNSGSSSGHKTILQCLRDCKLRGPESETDQAVREIEPKGDSSHRASVIRATTDSPMSPPHILEIGNITSKHSSRKSSSINNAGNKSLFDIVSTTEQKQIQKRFDFSGRICTPPGQVAKLYPNIGANKTKEGETNAG